MAEATKRLDLERRCTLDARKNLHDALEEHLRSRGAWLISIAGEPVMRFEAMPDSALPDELRALGYLVVPVGSTMRIVPAGHVELLTTTSSGGIEAFIEGSTKAPQRVHHAGIHQTNVYELTLPPGAKPK